jgi:hypothetical protein
MDVDPPKSGRDHAESARRIERLPDGSYFAHLPVWTARVAILRTNCRAATIATAWTMIVAYLLILLLVVFVLWLVMQPFAGWVNYTVFVFVAVCLGLLVYLIIQKLVALKVAASYREALGQLIVTDLGRLLAEDSWHRLIRGALEEQPWYRYALPQPPRTFEQQLEAAALHYDQLLRAAFRPIDRVEGLGSAALHHLTSAACGVPVAVGCCLVSVIGSCLGYLLFALASIGIAGSVLTRRARLIAICDFLLEEVDPQYALGWAMPFPRPVPGTDEPEPYTVDIVRQAVREARKRKE